MRLWRLPTGAYKRAPLARHRPSRMSGQISRLTTVSHVLYDREVLELRQMNARLREEIEQLKTKLAQRDSVIAQLSNATIRLMFRWAHPLQTNRVAPSTDF